MRKTLGILMAMAVLGSPVYAKKMKELPEVQVVAPAKELTQEMIQEILSGTRPEIAIELEKGVRLPLKFFGNYKVFSVKFDPHLAFKVEKRCYIRVVKSKTYISYDLKSWSKPDFFEGAPDLKVGLSKDKSHVLIEQSFQAFNE